MFKIDNMSQKPVYEQLIEQTERYILMGVINAGDAMPSVRKLSLEASVNPNTIQKAYSELTGRGVLISVPGKGCFVSEDAVEIIGKDKRVLLGDIKNLAIELKLAGVTLDEIISTVKEIYSF